MAKTKEITTIPAAETSLKKGEQTMAQSVFGIAGLAGIAGGGFPVGYTGFGAVGGPFYNGFGSIGLNGAGFPLGTWSNYELMDRNPTVACAAAVADAPGVSVELSYESKSGTPADRKAFIREQLAPWERYLMSYGHRCCADGFHAQEIVYGTGYGAEGVRRIPMTTLEKCKALFPWSTTPKTDIHGNLLGINNQGLEIDDPRRCLWIPYDDRSCYLFGRSRKNNFAKPWLRSEYLYDFLEYAMGIMVRPLGSVSFPFDGSGSEESKAKNTQAKANAGLIGQGLSSGQFALVPDIFSSFKQDMIKQGLDPKQLMPYQIDWYKTNSDSGEAFERLFRVTDSAIVMGHLRSPRTMMESAHGSRADAEKHSDSGDLVGDQVVQLICGHINKTIIDTLLVQNYGPDAKGTVWMQPAKIGNNKELTTEMVLGLVKGVIPLPLLLRMVDMSAEFERAGVKTLNFKVEDLIAEYDKRKQDERAVGEIGDGKGGGKEKPGGTGKTGNSDAPVDKAASHEHKYGTIQIDIPINSEADFSLNCLRGKINDGDLMGDGKDIEGNHVTVRYGLENSDDLDGLRDYLASIPKFSVTLGTTDRFPASKSSDGADVIIAPVYSAELHQIHNHLAGIADFAQSSHPDYRPHATVAYVNPSTSGGYVGMTDSKGQTFTVSSVCIKTKSGDSVEVQLGTKLAEKLASLSAIERDVTPGTVPGDSLTMAERLREYFTSERKNLGNKDATLRQRRDRELASLLLMFILGFMNDEATHTAVKLKGSPGMAALAIKAAGPMLPEYAMAVAADINQKLEDQFAKKLAAITPSVPEPGPTDLPQPELLSEEPNLPQIVIDELLGDDSIKDRAEFVADDVAYKSKMLAQLAILHVLPSVVGWYWIALPGACMEICLPRNGEFFSVKSIAAIWARPTKEWFSESIYQPGFAHPQCRCRICVLLNDGSMILL